MAHGGYPRRGAAVRRPKSSASAAAADRKRKRAAASKTSTLKNQIRSTERFLRKDLPNDIRVAQEKKLEDLKRQQELQNELAVQRTVQLRDRKIKFFERRKIERMIRRLEKQQRSNADDVGNKLSKLREDLEYVRFFPKNEKYVSLFAGGNNLDIVEKRNKWRKQIKENLMAAAANGKDLEETASDDDTLDVSDDDFFMSGSSSDEEADDEWTDKSAKEPASSASGRAASGMSSDEKNQRQRDARVLMPPPRSLAPNRARSANKHVIYSSSNTSNSTSGDSVKNRRVPNHPGDHNSNLSSNSDAHKPRRKRRPKKKKKLA
ncbi:rRNA-processing protein EFG1-like [Phragmites australis]|uniref:rRNA-processing protein EFG1-like n=1 Tax=Phragmites australis TaxID=29695 RepID=UPI002D77CBAD|nr:rRNA-processing protein EFG1-like [Phragmites australis]